MSEQGERDLARELDALTREVKNVRELVLAYNPRIRELEDRQDAAVRQLSALGTRMDAAEARPDTMEDRLGAAERASGGLAARIGAVENRRQAADAWGEEVRRELDTTKDALNGVRADLDDLRRTLDYDNDEEE